MSCFDEEIKRISDKILSCRREGDLCFAMLSDSHLSEERDDTCENIRAVDKLAGFDFVVHFGNIINGDNPRKISEYVLKREIDSFRAATRSGLVFASCGDTDGWRDERFSGQIATGIINDDFWYGATGYIDGIAPVCRPEKKPYYYIDYDNVRIIVLCSYLSQLDEDAEVFEKSIMIDAQQQAWLKKTALADCGRKHIIVFSHRIPKSRFESGFDSYVYEGRHTEAVSAIFQRAQLCGANLVCRIGGGYGYDFEFCHGGQNIAVIGSQIAREVNDSRCGGVRFLTDRKRQTPRCDLWDAAVVRTDERKLMLFRFGCGEDRVISY